MKYGAFMYDPESKQQSFQWKQLTFPCTNKARMLKSPLKTMLITSSIQGHCSLWIYSTRLNS